MKKIRFRSLNDPIDPRSAIVRDHFYNVALGNGAYLYFASSRHAEQFHACALEFLNGALFRANMLLADVYPLTRYAWHYLDKKTDPAITELIHTATDRMDRSLRSRGGTDFVHHAWKDVRISVDAVREIALLLSAMYRGKGHGVERARMDLIVTSCNTLLDELQHYGKSKEDAPNAKIIQALR